MAPRIKPGFALLGVLVWLTAWGHAVPAWAAQATCPEVAERGVLNVLSINLLATEIPERDRRLRRIAKFAVKRNVDVILLQEVVGGDLFDTDNSARDLRRFLKARGLRYNLRSALEVGLPDQAFVGNAVLSRCKVRKLLVHQLPLTDELEIFGLNIVFPRNVMMTRLKLPGFGRVDVFNTHLCAGCNTDDLGVQVDSMLDFVGEVEGRLAKRLPVVLGGDLNLNRFGDPVAEGLIYDDILSAGLRDAYAEAKGLPLDDLCNPKGTLFPDQHCTIGEGVTPLSGSVPARIDYVFEDGFASVRRSSQVVFNPLAVARSGVAGASVSDHAGLLIRLKLPK